MDLGAVTKIVYIQTTMPKDFSQKSLFGLKFAFEKLPNIWEIAFFPMSQES